MGTERLKDSILANAEELRRLHAQIDETLPSRGRSPEGRRKWEAACQAFHSRYDALAFPGGYSGALERIAAGEPNAVEAALCFLEARPYFFRSGYMYKDILRKAKKAALPRPQAQRLSRIVIAFEEYRAERRKRRSPP